MSFVSKLIKRVILPVLATTLIVLALLVGLARLLLPQVPQYKEDIQRLAEQATGFAVDFGQISAGISMHGPELRLEKTRISIPQEGLEVVYAEEVKISIDLMTLLVSRKVVPSHTAIRGVRVDLVREEDGALSIQGRTLADWLRNSGDQKLSVEDLPNSILWLYDVTIGFEDRYLQRPLADFLVEELSAELESGVLILEGRVEPEVRFGDDIILSSTTDLEPLLDDTKPVSGTGWELSVNVPDLNISQWISLLPDEMSPVKSGAGEGLITAKMVGGIPDSIRADLKLDDLVIEGASGEKIIYDRIAGELRFTRQAINDASKWRVSGENFSLVRGGQEWPTGSFDASMTLSDQNQLQDISFNASYINLNNLMPLVATFARAQIEEAGFNTSLVGKLHNVHVRASMAADELEALKVRGDFSALGYADPDREIVVRGISGKVDAALDKGQLELGIRGGYAALGFLSRGPVEAEELDALLVWRTGSDGLTLLGNGIRLKTPFGNGKADFELTQKKPEEGEERGALLIDLSATATAEDVRGVVPLLPTKIPAVVLDWLEDAVQQGTVTDAQFALKGDLRKFPFVTPEDGVFNISVPISDGVLKFAPDWPAVEDLHGLLVFDRITMYSRDNSGSIVGTDFVDIDARMTDLRTGVLAVDGSVASNMPAVLRLLRESAISKALGSIINDVDASGEVTGDVSLYLPVKNLVDYGFKADLEVSDAELRLNGIDYPVSDVNGRVLVDRTQLTADDVQGVFLQAPVAISMRPPLENERGISQLVKVSGTSAVDRVADALRLPFPERYDGTLAWQARALFPQLSDAAEGTRQRQFEIVVDSTMEGMSIDLPQPLMKSAESVVPLSAYIRFPEPGRFDVVVSADSGVSGNLRFEKQTEDWVLERGGIDFGNVLPTVPAESGLEVSGEIERIDVAEWLDLVAEYTEEAGAGSVVEDDFIRRLNLSVGQLELMGYNFPNSVIKARQQNAIWSIDVRGPNASGRLSVPSDFQAGRPLMADMERLALVDETSKVEEKSPDVMYEDDDPRNYPSMLMRAGEFRLFNMNFGALEFDVASVERGLKVRRIEADGGSFQMTAEGDWYITDPVNLVNRTRMRLNIDTTDVEDSLVRLGYEPLVAGKQGNINADLTWEGVPGMGMVYDSKGTFGFRVDKGQIANVDPGGGRLLGLLSFTSLPRRLSLDFSDVFDDGLGFDKLKGSFTMNRGKAYTCNVTMSGSVTDMAIIGHSDLKEETYDQLLVLRPHMSNVVPLGTAVLAGPVAGAAVWLVAAIFKEPLSSIGETYYQILGTWDEPQIDKIERTSINTQSFKECQQTLPEFSLEDLAALEELRLAPEVVNPEEFGKELDTIEAP